MTAADILARRERLVAFAEATHRKALANQDNAVPWRYLRWRREHREIKERLAWFHNERANINREQEILGFPPGRFGSL